MYYFVLIMIGSVSAVFLPSAVLIGCGILPTIAVFMVAEKQNTAQGIVMFNFNIIGISPHLFTLWSQGHTLPNVINILHDPATWTVMYGSAFLGWGFYIFMTFIIHNVIVLLIENKMNSIKKQQKSIISKWGSEVKAAATQKNDPQAVATNGFSNG